MKFKIEQEALLQVLQKVAPIIGIKTIFPVINYVKVCADEKTNRVDIYATSLELEINATVDADVSDTGEVLVHGKKFLTLVNLLNKGSLTLSTDKKGNFELKAKTGKWRIGHYAAIDDFPAFSSIGETPTVFKFDNQSWWLDVDRVTYAAAGGTTSTRFNLQTVNIHTLDDGTISLVATDGHRLAKVNVKDQTSTSPVKVLLASDILDTVRGSFHELKGDIEIQVGEKRVVFYLGNIWASAQLVDGDYPDYTQVLPKERGVTIRVRKTQILDAIRRAVLFSPNAVKIVLAEGKKPAVTSVATEEGDAFELIDGEKAELNCEVILNSTYLIDAISSIVDEQFDFDLGVSLDPDNDRVEPTQVTPLDDSTQLAIIMPMRK